jgi:hypothetical protein
MSFYDIRTVISGALDGSIIAWDIEKGVFLKEINSG